MEESGMDWPVSRLPSIKGAESGFSSAEFAGCRLQPVTRIIPVTNTKILFMNGRVSSVIGLVQCHGPAKLAHCSHKGENFFSHKSTISFHDDKKSRYSDSYHW